MPIDLRSLIQFVAVAEEMSFTRAAQRLAIAQPWLSKRIALLEDQLSFRLFDRTTRRIELTAAGRTFLEAAQDVAATVQRTEQLARSLGRAERQTLRIGTPPYGGRLAVRNAILACFAREQASVALEIDIGWTPVLLDRVLTGDLDGAFGIGWQQPVGLRRVALADLVVRLRVGPNDPLFGLSRIELDALKGRRVAVFMRGLYPALFDRAISPMALAGADLIQVSEVHDRLIKLDTGPSPLTIAEFGQHLEAGAKSAAVVSGLPTVPFSLFVAEGRSTPALAALTALARKLGRSSTS